MTPIASEIHRLLDTAQQPGCRDVIEIIERAQKNTDWAIQNRRITPTEHAIIQVAIEAAHKPTAPQQARLRQQCQQGPINIHSNHLGATITVVLDEISVPDTNPYPVYTCDEIARLVGKSPEQLREIHAVKTAFDGQVV